MTQSLYLALVVLLAPLPAFGQQNQAAVPCPATEKAVLEVMHQIWLAFDARDVATLDRLLDQDLIGTDDVGNRKGKKQLIAKFKQP